MALFQNQVLTDDGWDALSTALGGGRLTFYKLVAGDGSITDDSDLPPMTELVNHVTDIPISTYRIDGQGQITLTGILASSLIQGPGDVDGLAPGNGFRFRELGVYAVIEDPVPPFGGTPARVSAMVGDVSVGTRTIDVPDPPFGTPLLYSVTNAEGAADYIPGDQDVGATEVVNVIEVTIVIDRAENVVVILSADPGGPVNIENIGPPTVGAGPYAYRLPPLTNNFWFKRLVMGPNIEIIEDDETITIGVKTLVADLDLYVPLTNPGGTPETRFANINDALDYLADITIPAEFFATINVDSGVFDYTSMINIKHAQGSQIKIIGANLVSAVVTGPWVYVTGGLLDYDFTVPVSVADSANFAAGDYAILDNGVGQTAGPSDIIYGVWPVVSSTPGLVRLKMTPLGLPILDYNFSTARLRKYNSVLRFTGSDGFRMDRHELGLLSNMVLIGDSVSINPGIRMLNSGKVELQTVGLREWVGNIIMRGSGVILKGNDIQACSSKGTSHGISVQYGAHLDVSRVIANGNAFMGIQTVGARSDLIQPISACCNANYGINSNGSVVECAFAQVSRNGAGGISSINAGAVHASSARTDSNAPNFDLFSANASSMNVANVATSTPANPAVNVIGNNNSINYV